MTSFLHAYANGRTLDGGDAINAMNARAQAMAAERGAANIANATIGSLFDDHGQLWLMPTVAEVLHSIPDLDYASYSPMNGLPGFHDAVRASLFRGQEPEGFVEVAATVGGTGALHQAVQNYSQPGDVVLAPDWFWEPYANIACQVGRRFETYPLFADDDSFNVAAMSQAMERALAQQDSVILLLNSPANNPTGYALSDDEWQAVIAAANAASTADKHVILVIDVAYLDLAAPQRRHFLRVLEQAGENVLTLVAVSLSKGYTIYGMRSGALVCVNKERAVTKEFHDVMELSNRVTWSNSPRAPQVMLQRIWSSAELTQRLLADQAHGHAMLESRSQAFLTAAREHGIDVCPYSDGFFTVIRDEDPWALADALGKDAIFGVPVHGKGLRVSIASLSQAWARRIPEAVAALRV